MVRKLHLICKQFKGVSLLTYSFETASWVVTDKAADELKNGGRIYLYETQISDSYLAGEVLDWIQDPRTGEEERKIFICKRIEDISSGVDKRWGREQARDYT